MTRAVVEEGAARVGEQFSCVGIYLQVVQKFI